MRLLSVVVMTGALFSAACASTGVRFTFASPGAGTVSLAGSFNQWSVSSHPMTRARSTGAWAIVVRLPPGEHLFMYVVDGTQWISPPFAEDFMDDGFGTRNGIVVVRPSER
jgi:1,4-alpha-glucan branching enzyme